MDIDECVRATAGCSPHAGCINSQGGFTCTCYYGFSGMTTPTWRCVSAADSLLALSLNTATSPVRMHMM